MGQLTFKTRPKSCAAIFVTTGPLPRRVSPGMEEPRGSPDVRSRVPKHGGVSSGTLAAASTQRRVTCRRLVGVGAPRLAAQSAG
jgi:hypothetical protein